MAHHERARRCAPPLRHKRTLADATDGLLAAHERDALARRPAKKLAEEQWTRFDLAVLDEAEALTSGPPRMYEHVVVDEAQDLSPMELRMVARRARAGSLTILGDLAQATAPAAQTSWDDALAVIAAPKPRLEELTVGYRVPAPIIDFANRLLPAAAPTVRATGSVRTRGEAPRVVRTTALAATVAAEAAALCDRWNTTGVIVPPELHDEVSTACAAAGLTFTDGRRASQLDEHLTLLSPVASKGLEFDAVLVVEPAQVVAAGDIRGVRALYVALTRAVHALTVVHAEPLPAVLQ